MGAGFREKPFCAKKPQLLGYLQNGTWVPQTDTHAQVNLAFQPKEDGVTFELSTKFYPRVPAGNRNMRWWSGLSVGTKLDHSRRGEPILSPIFGPVRQLTRNEFCLELDRTVTLPLGDQGLWFLAEHPGDNQIRSCVQQAFMKVPPNRTGQEQVLVFDAIPNQSVTRLQPISLRASSSAGLKTRFFVKEGPAEVKDGVLHFCDIPVKAKLPLKVTVVAWQWGRSGQKPIKTAVPVSQSFWIVR